ncbi:hypothetical protein OED52_11595 [Rhodococcus sp. Z13]|uniref:Uncharacterized protein n=1 Tax=Rhodococcus sacchari TaxID=2962047 RepID=A0ACD4DBI7_9NOCA|nr:hypothetical protein [Rhodococcus sp. Z13]UYP17352.1 hypothetical protein OED52_11595 [Rhodococcus sp. Z13]
MDIWVPVVVALVTGSVTSGFVFLRRELARRNLRTRVAADLAIYKELGDEFRKRALRESIDARLWQLAAQSMPLPAGSRPKPRFRRVLALAGVVLAIVAVFVVLEWFLGIGDELSVRVAAALLGGVLVGFWVPALVTEPTEARDRQLTRALRERRSMEQLQNGSGAAGAPPDLADIA